jgi:hypothetical protein
MKALLLLALSITATAQAAPRLNAEAQAAGDAWCKTLSGDPAARFVRHLNPAGPRLAYCRVWYGRKVGVTMLMVGEAPEATRVSL